MKKAVLAVLLIAFAALPARAATTPNQTCRFSHGIEEVSKVADLPAGIRADLPAEMADKDQPYKGDSLREILTAGSFGLMRAGHGESPKGTLWFVLYSAGVQRDVVRFYKPESGSFLYFRPDSAQKFDTVCKQFDALLDSGPP